MAGFDGSCLGGLTLDFQRFQLEWHVKRSEVTSGEAHRGQVDPTTQTDSHWVRNFIGRPSQVSQVGFRPSERRTKNRLVYPARATWSPY